MNMASLEGLLGEEAVPAVVESVGSAWGKAAVEPLVVQWGKAVERGKDWGATEIAR